MVALPILVGAVLRILLGLLVDRVGAKNTGIMAQLVVITGLAPSNMPRKASALTRSARAPSTRRLPARWSKGTRRDTRHCQSPPLSAESASPRRSHRRCFGCVARERATWSGTPWSSIKRTIRMNANLKLAAKNFGMISRIESTLQPSSPWGTRGLRVAVLSIRGTAGRSTTAGFPTLGRIRSGSQHV